MHWIDPDCLPETTGVVKCFLSNIDGEADGLILTDGTEVHFPPLMGVAVLARIEAGAPVRVRGVRPRGVAMVAAVAIAAQAAAVIVDDGPDKSDGAREAARARAHGARRPMQMEGIVGQVLHGPKGEVRGVLLEDGVSGRFPPHEGARLAPMLRPGARIVLRGDGLATGHGTVIALREIGPSAETLQAVAPKPKKKHAPGHDKHGHHGHEHHGPKHRGTHAKAAPQA